MTDWTLLGIDGPRWILSAFALLIWLTASALWLRKPASLGDVNAELLITYASQTGTAQRMAELTYEQAMAEGRDAALLPLHNLDAPKLTATKAVVFVASTTGIGDAPDPSKFVEKSLLEETLDLSHLRTFILALGDRSYEHYCAFGEKLHSWAGDRGAQSHIVTVDDQSENDLANWDALMNEHALPALQEKRSARLKDWVIEDCEQVAIGDTKPIVESRAGPLYRVQLTPKDDEMLQFAVGDLFEWTGPQGEKRDFSIASVPGGKSIELFVRQVELPGGDLGKASSALTNPNDSRKLRGQMKTYASFHRTVGRGPLLVIAAGSGWGGVRAHVLDAIANGRKVWVAYGDRGPDENQPIFSEMRGWNAQGRIQKLSLALSQAAEPQHRYVQDSISASNDGIAVFLGSKGAVVICGATQMGMAVEAELEKALPVGWIGQAKRSDRWRSATY
ncbi:MAG: flavodoxin domain-containing protein [Pseudomonadota bacterium]